MTEIEAIEKDLKSIIKTLTIHKKRTKIKLELNYNLNVNSLKIIEIEKKEIIE